MSSVLCKLLFTPQSFVKQMLLSCGSVVKNPPASAGDIKDMGSVPGLGGSPGGGHGNRLQYSGLENPMDRGAWKSAVQGVTQSQAQLR